MSTDIQPFNVTDHIRDKVREVLVSSIPDQEMDKMINSEFEAFFAKSRHGSSPFGSMVHKILQEEMEQKVKAWITSNLQTVWEHGENKFIGEVVTRITPLVQQAMVESLVQNVLRTLTTTNQF